MRKQQTLQSTVSLDGVGYWSGQKVTLTFEPAPEDHGIQFLRTDQKSPHPIPATIHHQVPTPLRTILSHQGQTVAMVEHVLAALYAMNIDNCLVKTTAEEMPGLDGSCLPLTDLLQSAGIARQNTIRQQLVIEENCRLVSSDSPDVWLEATPAATPTTFSLEYHLHYDHPAIGTQYHLLDLTPQTFLNELTDARTFILEEEANALHHKGLGLHVTDQELLYLTEGGPRNNSLRYPNECVRHKMLDMVGDFSLAGVDLVGHFVASRTGHQFNAELIRRLLSSSKKSRSSPTEQNQSTKARSA
ncbi:MAG: UDP-3-O-acyl-N-acetylglucosamine deacetylase [Pirellulaceae bacterium]|nr:UDP-3-O-acyl-N-acetylglucosamine deacetylase [Pirellulaceae bacterium]